MSVDRKKVLSILSPGKIWIPASISIGFVVYMLITDTNFSPDKLALIRYASWLPLSLAFLLLFVKEWMYVLRIRFLADKKLSFTASTYVIMLWEFASAVTPSVVGGTPVAVFLLMKEGLNMGKSLALAMVTAIFDNLYLILITPIVYLIYRHELFNFVQSGIFAQSIPTILLISYLLVLAYTAVMAFALFMRPRWFKWLLIKFTSIRFLRKWRYAAYQHGNEILLASKELAGKSVQYWWKISYTSFLSWTARFFMLNFMVAAFLNINLTGHMLIYAKHVVLWITMLASPTPGSSFAAEMGFTAFFESTFKDFLGILTLLWRGIGYYPFLLLGAILIPRWISRVYFQKESDDES